MSKISSHPNFPGTYNDYTRIHRNVQEILGKPSKCVHCGTIKAKVFDWANISGNYLMVSNDWMRLCRSCHFLFDKSIHDGTRFSGKRHTAASKAKIAATMKAFWAANHEYMMKTKRMKLQQ